MRQLEEGMVPLEDVQRVVLGSFSALMPLQIEISAALGLVLAADVRAPRDIPPFANTAMDGYAVRAGDTTAAPVELSVIGLLAAGTAPSDAVAPGTAIQIMTGAPMPPGADAIAIVERTEPGSARGTVRILETVAPGDFVRPAGSDLLENIG